jgi:uncharacterized protein involved in type VI secretion and phage assembly
VSVRPDGGTQLYYGLYPAVVTDSTPDDQGRIEVELKFLGKNPSDEAGQQGDAGEFVRNRATLMSAWGSADQGLVAVPIIGSQVMVAFEAGNLSRAYVVGACWNGVAQMPSSGSGTGDSTRVSEDRRLLRTKGGHYLELDEASGSSKVTLASSNGHKLTLDADASSITIQHANGQTITLGADGGVTITANNAVTINAPSGLTVSAPTAAFSGIVTCTTLNASAAVVSPTYTPGIGNLL